MPIQIGAKGATIAGKPFPPYAYIDWLTPDQEALAIQGGDAYSVPKRGFTLAEETALRGVASEAGFVDSYSDDTWVDVPAATGLVIPLPVFVKAVRLLGGTSPTLVLRDALVDTYTAASSSTDVPFDSTVTPVTLGAEIALNRYFRMGVHATPGGTAPRWAIKV